MHKQNKTMNTFLLKPLQTKLLLAAIAVALIALNISAPFALLLGLIIAQVPGVTDVKLSKFTGTLLKIAVVGLGFGIQASTALEIGQKGLILSSLSVSTTFLLGFAIYKILKLDRVISYLISSGTAICGGSAIAAISPIIKAKEREISVALGVVFMLNAFALFVFPLVGNWLELSQYQFGLWSGIAIHDTSSVVGAASAYGDEALKVATTVKLARVLWLIPLSLLSIYWFKSENQKLTVPYFIFYFILAIIVRWLLPDFDMLYTNVVFGAKKAMIVTLFLIGAGLPLKTIKQVGPLPAVLGISLWLTISLLTLGYVSFF